MTYVLWYLLFGCLTTLLVIRLDRRGDRSDIVDSIDPSGDFTSVLICILIWFVPLYWIIINEFDIDFDKLLSPLFKRL